MSGNPERRYISMNMGTGSKRPMNVLSDQSNAQTCISKYFKSVKADFKPSESDPTTSKRLHAKYDNFNNQPVRIPEKIPFPAFGPKSASEPRNDYAQQLTARELNPPSIEIRKRSSTTSKTADEKSRIPPEKRVRSNAIHLIGYVENALNWYEKMKNTEVYVVYNIIGQFLKAMDGNLELEKHVFIRGMNGCVLECRYFEVDQPLPTMIRGQQVACLGHVIGEQKFHLYNIYVLNETTNLDVQRGVFLSQRTVSEYAVNLSR